MESSMSLTPEMDSMAERVSRLEALSNGPWKPTRFANPIPLALAGFVMSASPLAAMLLEWRGSAGEGAANTTGFIFFGGGLMGLSGLLEFFYGNTYLFVVFLSYSAFFLSFGADFIPWFNIVSAYQPTDPATAALNPSFAASLAFVLLYMGLINIIFFLCALNTNLAFTLIFATLAPALLCLAAAEWEIALVNVHAALNLQKAGGGLIFAASLIGWYYLTEEMLVGIGYPIHLPLFDLSPITMRLLGGSKASQKTAVDETKRDALNSANA